MHVADDICFYLHPNLSCISIKYLRASSGQFSILSDIEERSWNPDLTSRYIIIRMLSYLDPLRSIRHIFQRRCFFVHQLICVPWGSLLSETYKYIDKCALLKAKHLFSRWLTGRGAFRQGTISKLILDSPLSMMFSPCKEINLTNTAQHPAKAAKQLRNYERMICESFRRALKIHMFL